MHIFTKIISTFLTLLVLQISQAFAEEIDFPTIIESSSIFIPDYAAIWEEVLLDIKDINSRLVEASSESNDFYYRWDIYNRSPLDEDATSIRFDTYWEKKISLNIFNNEVEQTLLFSKDYAIFVYESSLPLLVSENISEKEIEAFYMNAQNLWVYIYEIGRFKEADLDGKSIISRIEQYKQTSKNISDYVHIWWEKEFLLSAISQIGTQSKESDVNNFVLTSSYNASILQWYLWNSLAGKDFIKTAFILDESTTQRIIKNPRSIETLLTDLQENNYEFTSISNDITISPVLFISKFINSLSQNWVSTSDLYIILLIPLFLTSVAVAKHLIWLSTLGSIIPVFISILFIKVWFIFTLSLMVFLLFCNITISWFLNKYTLLYTPKVTCITIINIVIFMLFYSLWIEFNIFQTPLDNILYIIIFFIISEKLITIITSKEFREYKKSLFWTLVVSSFWGLMYYIDPLVVFITAYPEVLIVLIPLNFFLGRFTGLRITEYLRFKEIVKNIEE